MYEVRVVLGAVQINAFNRMHGCRSCASMRVFMCRVAVHLAGGKRFGMGYWWAVHLLKERGGKVIGD